MKEENAMVMSGTGPDLFKQPHVLPVLMEMLAGDRQQVLMHQEQLCTHLTTCHYCRTAVVFLLGIVQEYDHRNNNPEEPAHDLLVRFANIIRTIEEREASEYERLGAYAEAIVAEGQGKADLRFPDIATHLSICQDCRSALEATISSLAEVEETD